MSLYFEVKCSICNKALKVHRGIYRFTCMCDEEIRLLNAFELDSIEHGWRIKKNQAKTSVFDQLFAIDSQA